MNSKIAKKIEKIEQLRAQISSLPPLSKDVEKKLWDKLRLEWNYNSNHIEGNTISYIEAKQFLFKNITDNLHTMREWEELSGHNLAVETIKEWASNTEQPLNESDIRSLHTMILVKPYWSDAITANGTSTRREIAVGEYKSLPNSVRLDNGEIFHYTDPMNVPAEMKALIEWYRTSTNVHPLIKATDFHYKFIRIHPFDDGNGRLARLLLNYELLANGYPPVIIKSIDKKRYLNCLQAADEGNFEPFYEFVADCLIWSLELVLKAHNNESLEEPDDLEKEISLFKKNLKAKSSLDHLNMTAEEVKKHVFRQVEEFYLPFTNEISQKLSVEFGDIFENIENIHTSGFSGYKTNVNFAENYILINHILDNFLVDDYNNFDFQLTCRFSFSLPKFKAKTTNFSCLVEFRNKNSLIGVLVRNHSTKKLKEWDITETITDEEREELVNVVIKSIYEQIKNSVE